MANKDTPNGFYPFKTLSGGSFVSLKGTAKSATAIAPGDVLVDDGAGYLTVALATDVDIVGIASHAVTAAATDRTLSYYPAYPGYLFEAQCSGTEAQTDVYEAVDIEGTTGIQEVNEDASATGVFRIIGLVEDGINAIGLNARVFGFFDKSIWARRSDNVSTNLSYYEDFVGGLAVLPASLSVYDVHTSGTPTSAIKANETCGAWELITGAVSETTELYLDQNNNLFHSMLNHPVMEVRAQLSVLPAAATTSQTIALAIARATNSSGLPNEARICGFVILNGGAVSVYFKDGVTTATTSTGLTLTNADYHVFTIDASVTGDVKFYVDGVRYLASTTFAWVASAANSKVQPKVGEAKSAGTGVPAIIVDYIKIAEARAA